MAVRSHLAELLPAASLAAAGAAASPSLSASPAALTAFPGGNRSTSQERHMTTTRKHATRISSRLDRMTREDSQLRQEVMDLETEQARLVAANGSLTAHVAVLLQKLQDAESRIADGNLWLEDNRVRYEREASTLRDDIDSTTEDLAAAQADNERLELEAEEASDELADLRLEMSRVENAMRARDGEQAVLVKALADLLGTDEHGARTYAFCPENRASLGLPPGLTADLRGIAHETLGGGSFAAGRGAAADTFQVV